jgi:hypothetical protein
VEADWPQVILMTTTLIMNTFQVIALAYIAAVVNKERKP